MPLDADACYRALRARDRRFDGVFFVGVETTGVYCRPICPARTPGADRCRYYARAAEAERDGFRACFRCRPERAPGYAPVDRPAALVERALHEIAAGALDHGTVVDLAARLGVSDRHLRRAVEDAVGASPVELGATRRLGLAKALLQDTTMQITEVAFASGFASLRRFNAAFQERFDASPSQVRAAGRRGKRPDGTVVFLDARPPFAGRALLAFLSGRAIPGVEEVVGDTYRRTAKLGDALGVLEVRVDEARPGIEVRVEPGLFSVLPELLSRCRSLFDLDAQPAAVDAHLSSDPLLRDRVARAPGLRVPGAFEPFELAVRAVLGQQVSVRAATTLSGRLVRALGTPLVGERFLFPTPRAIATAGVDAIAGLGLPGARAATLIALASAVDSGALRLLPGADPADVMAAMTALPGIGPWTAGYVALRVLRSPDVFLSGDLGVRKALGGVTAKQAEARAEAWRPWRAYAQLHLWAG
jgi:AraC family transcriptional regulator of adaptative response / DNA-3-methyladenine glycosylase II